MQVIFLPRGSGRSHSFRLRLALAVFLTAGAVLAIGAGAGYLGYQIGSPATDLGSTVVQRNFTVLPGTIHPPLRQPAQPVEDQQLVERQPSRDRDQAALDQKAAEIVAAAGVERLTDLRAGLEEQRAMLHESRRRLGDQIDALGQRLGRIQAQVSRLNALGQRLTDMAGLDRAEFSFDNPPAIGGPERPGPWERMQEPEFADTLSMIEITLQEKENELQILEALLTDRELHQKQYPRGWPTAGGGWMSSAYGHRTDPFTGRKAFHTGVDIAARHGSEIRAMADGVVSFAGHKPGYGRVVEINHGNGYETRYAHAREIIAKVGDRVVKGDAVALIGSSGRSTGPHVHIEVLKNGKAINPGEHLNSSG